MSLMKLVVVCLLAVVSISARADEYDKFLDDVAAGKLDDLIGYKPKPVYPKYSYDITAHSNCVLENQSKRGQGRVYL